MKKTLLVVLLPVFCISACGGSSSGGEASPAPLGAVTDSTGGGGSGGDDSELEVARSLIEGNIALVNDTLPIGDVTARIRGTEISGTRQSNGNFALEVPTSDTDRTVVIDFTGASIVQHGVNVQIPAQAKLVVVDTTVTASTPPVTFNLEAGGKLQNEGSSTRTSVSVPANAFQFDDGTIATGNAQVSITEIDITDLHGDSAWAPNLIGIAEGMSTPSAIVTFGMSDFQFTQDGRQLDLRPGVEATIAMDLVAPYIMNDEFAIQVPATDGATMPFWHYDTVAMVWREEGETTIMADSQSDSGFSTSGQVSHFTTWNIDYVTPFTQATVNVIVVDQHGQVRNDKIVNNYSITVRIPPEDGPGHGGELAWSNTKNMAPHDNQITVLANNNERQKYIDEVRYGTDGWTTIDVIPNTVVVNNAEVVNHGLVPVNKRFYDYNDDNVVNFQIVMPTIPDEEEDPEPVEMTASVEIRLVDLDGRSHNDIDVLGYRATARTIGTSWQNVGNLTPASTFLSVQGNTQELIDAGQTVTTEIYVDNVVLSGSHRIGPNPISQTRVFKTFEGTSTVVFEVVVLPQ